MGCHLHQTPFKMARIGRYLKALMGPQALFLIGVFIRLGLILALTPSIVSTWYVPFMSHSIANWSFDPWGTWLAHGGDPQAFPYGYSMWLTLLPGIVMSHWMGAPAYFGYAITLLLTDLITLKLLTRLIPNRPRFLMITYWLSPIPILLSYALGFNDLIPIAWLTLALVAIQTHRFGLVGVALMASIATKFSMILAAPFFILFFFKNNAIRHQFKPVVIGALLVSPLLWLPNLLSGSISSMLIYNREVQKLASLTWSIGTDPVALLPLAYGLALYSIWRTRRLNFNLFITITGLIFLGLALLSPSTPGWILWAFPFLILIQAESDRITIGLIGTYAVLHSLLAVTYFSGWPTPPILLLQHPIWVFVSQQGHLMNLTLLLGIGGLAWFRLWRDRVISDPFFRRSRTPFLLGIAGDSGVGKDTLQQAVGDILGPHSVSTISGDDYHSWDRHQPMWKVMTHLNPLANHLDGFQNDVLTLASGTQIICREYNHHTGKMSTPHPKRSNDFVIASGLHVLLLPSIRKRCHLSIYLDMDESLRRHLKISRDVGERGHSLESVLANIEKRQMDANRFIHPQRDWADLVFKLIPLHSLIPNAPIGPCRLVVHSRYGEWFQRLQRDLIVIAGLSVVTWGEIQDGYFEIQIEGDPKPNDLSLIASRLIPHAENLLDPHAKWGAGSIGLMQLFTAIHIHLALHRNHP